MKKKLFLLPLYSLSLFGYNLETYLESWDNNGGKNCLTALQGIPATVTNYSNIVFDLAFCEFASPIETGLQLPAGVTIQNIKDAIPTGGKLKLSFGGANPDYYFNYSLYQEVASAITEFLAATGDGQYFNGVDFDIEGQPPEGTTPTQAATDICSFLQNIKPELDSPNNIVSVTIPGQGWNTYWQDLIQTVIAYEKANSTTLVDYWNFMEYDLWVASGLTLPQQIIADIQTYTGAVGTNPGPNNAPGWGIPPEKIQLGVMIGVDDEGNTLSVQDVIGLIDNAVIKYNLYGIMTWDLDRDALNPGASSPLLTELTPPITTPYSYFTNIYQTLNAASDAKQNGEALPRRVKKHSKKPFKFGIEYPPFEPSTAQRQDSPPTPLTPES